MSNSASNGKANVRTVFAPDCLDIENGGCKLLRTLCQRQTQPTTQISANVLVLAIGTIVITFSFHGGSIPTLLSSHQETRQSPRHAPIPSLFLPHSFPIPSPFLPRSFPVPSPFLPYSFPVPSLFLPRSFPVPSPFLPHSFPIPSPFLPRFFPFPSLFLPLTMPRKWLMRRLWTCVGAPANLTGSSSKSQCAVDQAWTAG